MHHVFMHCSCNNLVIHKITIMHLLCIPIHTISFVHCHSSWYLQDHKHTITSILPFTRSQFHRSNIIMCPLQGSCTPNLMLITSYPCNLLHQKHAYHPHSCLPNNAMLACHIFCEFNLSMISNKHIPYVGYHNQPIKYNYGYFLPCIAFSFHLWNIHIPNLRNI